MKTRITELFGIEHPIIQGGMHFVGLAEMASAVSNAGGLGIITGLTQGTPEKLANEIERCKDMTDKPFGVNMTFLPALKPPDYPGLFKAIIDSGVKVVDHKESRRQWPTMVAGVQNAEGRLCAIHRTWLAINGSGKAPVPPNSEKKSLGPVGGGAVRLALAAETVALAEGVEDALAILQMTGTPAWAVIGTSGFTSVELPRHIRRVILAPDGDEAGDKVIDPAARRLVRAGIEVRVVRPPRGVDWCDILGTFEERAAFLEHVGGEDREQAEREAWIDALGGRR